MVRALTLLSLLSLISMNAKAVSSSTVGNLDCSESLSISLSDTASFSCIGNFSLSHGGITSESKVVITSSGALTLDNLSIVAPIVALNSQSGQISIGSGVFVNTRSFLATVESGIVPTLLISPDASISVGTGESARVISSSELIESVNHGAITQLVSSDISITPSIPEPNIYVSMLLGLLMVIGITKGVRGSRYI
jgi:hypothetical protein